jgi:TolA-binding protein
MSNRAAGMGEGMANGLANRPQTLEGRRSDLQGRVSGGREDWQQHREGMQGNRQDFRDQHREDWQQFANDNINHHGDWYHDCWHGDWYAGAGWSHMWDNYPVAAALGVTRWGVNRLAYGFGYWGYTNPYYVAGAGSSGYDYSQPLVNYGDAGATAAAPTDTPAAATDPAAQTPTPPADPGMDAFAAARSAFYEGLYGKALQQLEITLQTMPNDSVVHEFRGLTLFAEHKYPESAAAVYAVLSAGPGWDWTTLSSLYPSVETYTAQLRKLEAFARQNPMSPDAAFLLGYHYLTQGHAEHAHARFLVAQTLTPNDRLIAQLVQMTAPPGESATASADTASATPADQPAANQPAAAKPVPADKVLKVEQVTGTWRALSHGSIFDLELGADGAFSWTYESSQGKQTIKGVFVVDANTLVMEPSAGGTMVAEVEFTGQGQFRFKMIGGDDKDPGLLFKQH